MTDVKTVHQVVTHVNAPTALRMDAIVPAVARRAMLVVHAVPKCVLVARTVHQDATHVTVPNAVEVDAAVHAVLPAVR